MKFPAVKWCQSNLRCLSLQRAPQGPLSRLRKALMRLAQLLLRVLHAGVGVADAHCYNLRFSRHCPHELFVCYVLEILFLQRSLHISFQPPTIRENKFNGYLYLLAPAAKHAMVLFQNVMYNNYFIFPRGYVRSDAMEVINPDRVHKLPDNYTRRKRNSIVKSVYK